MPELPAFSLLAAEPGVGLDELALALAASFRDVDIGVAFATLDALGDELGRAAAGAEDDASEQARACARLLGGTHGFAGDRKDYDHPDNSMLDLVLTRRRGLPILLSVVYVEVARRAGIDLVAVGLPGHFVVGHFGADPPLLLDPFGGGVQIRPDVADDQLRPWTSHETTMRMLNNLVNAFERRRDFTSAIRAAQMRLELPSERGTRQILVTELRAMQARFN